MLPCCSFLIQEAFGNCAGKIAADAPCSNQLVRKNVFTVFLGENKQTHLNLNSTSILQGNLGIPVTSKKKIKCPDFQATWDLYIMPCMGCGDWELLWAILHVWRIWKISKWRHSGDQLSEPWHLSSMSTMSSASLQRTLIMAAYISYRPKHMAIALENRSTSKSAST